MSTSNVPNFASMPAEVLSKLSRIYRESRLKSAGVEARRYSLASCSNRQGAMLSEVVKIQAPARVNEKTEEVEAPEYELRFDSENCIFTCSCGDYTGRVSLINAALLTANLPAELVQCKHAEMLPLLDKEEEERRKAARILSDLQLRADWYDGLFERLAEVQGLTLGGEIGPDELIDTAIVATEAAQQVPHLEASLMQAGKSAAYWEGDAGRLGGRVDALGQRVDKQNAEIHALRNERAELLRKLAEMEAREAVALRRYRALDDSAKAAWKHA